VLDTRQLRYFVAVADHLHFAKAAMTMNVAQSALSTQVRGLEELLGVRLFNRSKKAAVSLTQAGEMFLIEARQALKQVERTERVGRLAARGQLGRIDLGYIASAAISGMMAAALGEFRTTNPEVDIALSPLDTPSQLKALMEGVIDIGLIRPRPSYPEGLEALEVHSERLVLAMSDCNALSERNPISSVDLADQRFIVPQFEESVGFAEFLAQLGHRAGVEIEAAFKVPDFVSALMLASAGYGIVLIPASFRNLQIAGIVMRDIVDFNTTVSISLAWRASNQNRAASELIKAMRQRAR
jgi:LysR family transcriptional regulator, benzoate and cis,cis-muconate-responsive activator of ben and cat genes